MVLAWLSCLDWSELVVEGVLETAAQDRVSA